MKNISPQKYTTPKGPKMSTVLAGLTWVLPKPVCSRFWHPDTRELGNHDPPTRKDVTITL